MNETQKKKTKFRKSIKWRKFLHYKNVQQNGLCYITHKKLQKYAALHHADMNPEHYEDLSNPENFFYLCKSMHDCVHILWRYYEKDQDVLTRLKEVLDKMKELNA